MKSYKGFISVILAVVLLFGVFCGCAPEVKPVEKPQAWTIPEFAGQPYVPVNGNVPNFSESELRTKGYEDYSKLDKLGRCGVVVACVGTETMPTEDRGSIGQVKPTGWQTIKYDFVDGKYLYNRCHLIGFQLTGENANERNLITGTRYLNIEGMLPFENMVADYVKETGNHVMYRVTPVYDGSELVARGVLMEGYSVEDKGNGICFHVYAFNNQPGVTIDYATGESCADTQEEIETARTYILNTNSKKFHTENCKYVKDIKESNRQVAETTRERLITQGYSPCGSCSP